MWRLPANLPTRAWTQEPHQEHDAGFVLQFQDIVVSVARKTDAQMWPALFAAVGKPSKLLDELLDAGQLTSAACCLLLVDRIQGAQQAHMIAIVLIKVTWGSPHPSCLPHLSCCWCLWGRYFVMSVLSHSQKYCIFYGC